MACAWGAFVCYASMMLASFFIGQRVYPIRYDLKSAFRYTLLAVVLYAVAMVVPLFAFGIQDSSFGCVLCLFFPS